MKYDEIANRFWDNVNEMRLHRRLTWEELGNAIGTTGASLSTMKNMNRTPTIGYAIAIANALNVSLEELCITGRNTEENVDDDKLALTTILSSIANNLSNDDILTLIKLAEYFAEAHKTEKNMPDVVSDDSATYTTEHSRKLMDNLKRRYL